MKAKKVTAWACGSCGKPYKQKGLADTCCVCTRCGASGTAYPGHSVTCKRCQLESAIEFNQRQVRQTAVLLEQQEKELEDLRREPPRVEVKT